MTDSPLVLSLARLPRQAEAMLHEGRGWSAPVDSSTSSVSVPEDTKIPLSVDLASVSDGILVYVKTEVELKGEYIRCLDLVSVHHEIDASDICFETAPSPGEEDLEADDFLLIGTHNTIGLEPLLRNVIVTLINERLLCGEDCQGLYGVYDEKRADFPADHSHESIDPRLAALASLLESDQKEAD